MLIKSLFSPISVSSSVFPNAVILVSSAKILGVVKLRQFGRSLMYVRKRSGPKIVYHSSDMSAFGQSNRSSEDLALSLSSKIAWFTVSKDFLRPRETTTL